MRAIVGKDFRASIVVFLAALPFCVGVAAASGLTATQGLISGIVGGVVAGLLGGAPLQVSGPAVGLAAVTLGLVATRGAGALGAVVIMAGLIQVLAGMARLGRFAHFIPAGVIAATMLAAGAMQAVAQTHVVLGGAPLAGFSANALALLPHLLEVDHAALMVGLLTIAVALAWDLAPGWARVVPAALVGVTVASAAAWACAADVSHLVIPATLSTVRPAMPAWSMMTDTGLLGTACVLALLASAESLMAGNATASMIEGAPPRHDRELMALGASNLVCGLFGALPVAGVVVRSVANVRAGAQTRLSTILHGLWLLLAVLFAGDILRMVPTAALAALLVLGGARLVRLRQETAMTSGGALLFGVTLGVILAVNLPAGVAAGCACAMLLRGARQALGAARRAVATGRRALGRAAGQGGEVEGLEAAL